MKIVVLPSGKTISVPSSGEDWQLYTSSMACGRAANALTAALVRVAKEIDRMASKGYRPTAEGAETMYASTIEPVMSKYSAFGALDTEPRNVAYDAIERVVMVVTGSNHIPRLF